MNDEYLSAVLNLGIQELETANEQLKMKLQMNKADVSSDVVKVYFVYIKLRYVFPIFYSSRLKS